MGCKHPKRGTVEQARAVFQEQRMCYPSDIFVNKEYILNKYQCPIMWGVINGAVKAQCGHIFCNSCLQTATRVDERRLCPVCRQNIGEVKEDHGITEIIRQSQVKCVHTHCQWRGTAKSFYHHLKKECKYEACKCSSCGEAFASSHDLHQHIENKCSSHPSHPCTNCGKLITKLKLEEHKRTCLNTRN